MTTQQLRQNLYTLYRTTYTFTGNVLIIRYTKRRPINK